LEIASIAPDLVEQLVIVCSRDTPFPSFAAAADGLDAGDPIDTDSAVHTVGSGRQRSPPARRSSTISPPS